MMVLTTTRAINLKEEWIQLGNNSSNINSELSHVLGNMRLEHVAMTVQSTTVNKTF